MSSHTPVNEGPSNNKSMDDLLLSMAFKYLVAIEDTNSLMSPLTTVTETQSQLQRMYRSFGYNRTEEALEKARQMKRLFTI